MSCTNEIVRIAVHIIRSLLQLPSEKLFEEVEVPVRTATTSISYTRKRRVRYGLAHRHESFKVFAREVGAALAQHYNLTPLLSGAGSTFDPDDELTAGFRFLSRLIDAAIAGREKFPSLVPKLKQICQKFEAQIAAAEIGIEWIYPLPLYTVPHPVQLSRTVRLRELSSKSLERLDSDRKTGFNLPRHILLQMSLELAIRTTESMPISYPAHQNHDILQRLTLAFILSDLLPPIVITYWDEPCEPSVFQLGHTVSHASWQTLPLGFYPRELSSDEIALLKRSYRELNVCGDGIPNSLPEQRLISAAYRPSYDDRVIDLWIALEALLLTKDEKSEMIYRMTNRAAWIVQPTDLPSFKKKSSPRLTMIVRSLCTEVGTRLIRTPFSAVTGYSPP